MREKVYLIILIIITIFIDIIGIYYSFYTNWPKKHFEMVNKWFPKFLIWPKNERTYILLFKVASIGCLLFMITILLIFIFVLP